VGFCQNKKGALDVIESIASAGGTAVAALGDSRKTAEILSVVGQVVSEFAISLVESVQPLPSRDGNGAIFRAEQAPSPKRLPTPHRGHPAQGDDGGKL
jgi:hypothetical protein